MIIVILGRAGSGKTTIAREVCKLTNLPLVEMSTIVQKLQQRSKQQRGQINIDKDQREKKDPDWLWREVQQEIVGVVGEGLKCSCVISGIREPYLLHKLLTDHAIIGISDVFIIGLDVNDFNRYSRLCARDGFMSIKDFRAIDNGTKEKDDYVGDNELGLDISLTGCNVVIDANMTLSHTVQAIEKVLFDKQLLFRKS